MRDIMQEIMVQTDRDLQKQYIHSYSTGHLHTGVSIQKNMCIWLVILFHFTQPLLNPMYVQPISRRGIIFHYRWQMINRENQDKMSESERAERNMNQQITLKVMPVMDGVTKN